MSVQTTDSICSARMACPQHRLVIGPRSAICPLHRYHPTPVRPWEPQYVKPQIPHVITCLSR